MTSYNTFKEIIIVTIDSIDPKVKILPSTVKSWYEKYFKFYSKDILQDIFDDIAAKYDWWPSLHQIFSEFEARGYRPLIHEQIRELEKQMKERKTDKLKDLSLKFIPHSLVIKYFKEKEK